MRNFFSRSQASSAFSSILSLTTPTAYYSPQISVTVDANNGVSQLDDIANDNRENRCLQSEGISTASWTDFNTARTANAAIAPDGTLTADKVAESTVGTVQYRAYQTVTTVSGTRYRSSFYAKAAERSWVYLYDGNSSFAIAYFNLSNGTIGTVGGTGSPSNATIENIGNGWYRCSFEQTALSTAINIQCGVSTADNTISYAGTPGSGAYFWGAQVSLASASPTYLPTTTTAILSSAFPATQGTAANRPVLSGNDGLENLAIYSEVLNNAIYTTAAFNNWNNVAAKAVDYWTFSRTTATVEGAGQIRTVYPSRTYVFSVDLKAGTKNTATLTTMTGLNGTIVATSTESALLNLTADYQTYSRSVTCPASGVNQIHFCVGNAKNDGSTCSAGTVYIRNFQVRDSNTTAGYLATTTYPIYQSLNGNVCPVYSVDDSLSTTLAVDPTGGMSWAGIVKQNALTVASMWVSAFTGGAGSRFFIRAGSSGQIECNLYNALANTIGRTCPNGSVVVNQAAVFSFTYDGTTNATGIKVYKNGVQIDTGSTTGGSYTVGTAGDPLVLGSAALNGFLGSEVYKQGSYWSAEEHAAIVARMMLEAGI